jgi:glutamyl-tRNA reductase
MQIVMTGLSHRTAPLVTRESVSLTREALPAALAKATEMLGHGVVLSTCNRTEVYTVARDVQVSRDAMDRFFMSLGGNEDLGEYLYFLEQEQAIQHLFRVSAGLDSLIIGESEILGQIRDAFAVATKQGATIGVLSHAFHSAIRAGKRARTETQIGWNALSTSRACVELSRRSLGDLSDKHGLIVGIGEASKLAAQAMRDAGIGILTIANRTPANAQELASAVNAQVAPLDQLPALIADANVVVTSTGAPDYVISEPVVAAAMRARRDTPLLMIDMAVPRDIDPYSAAIDNVFLHTLDDLQDIAAANRREREAEAKKVEKIVDQEVAKFATWWAGRSTTPTIAALRYQAEEIRATEVAETITKMEGLTIQEAQRINAMTKSLVKKLLHDPTKALRDHNDESFTQAARELFGLDE